MMVFAALAEARVTHIVVISRDIVADGASFGASGPYEKLRGTVFFEVDPADPRNAVVFDLDKAPRNARGMVEFSADWMIIKPVDLSRGNHELFFEVNNRGNKIAYAFLNDTASDASQNNPTTSRDFGNGFLQRRGYTVAWVGWQGDLPPGADRLTAQLPVATEYGKPITERILAEFFDVGVPGGTSPVFTLPLSGSPSVKSYETVSTDPSAAQAELRMRSSDSPRPSAPDIPDGEVVPINHWSFAKCPTGPPGIPSTTDICIAGGFKSDMVYQLVYRATKPTVMGLGYVTTRDFVSFLRHAAADDDGNPNPVPGFTTVLGYGASQDGNYLRDFLYQGFNEDEQGLRVFDGVNIQTAGIKKLFLNYRFAQPSNGSSQHQYRYVPNDTFPHTYAVREDPLHGTLDGILKRPETDPKIIHTVSSREYWQSQASLVGTDENGTTDIDLPENARAYLFSSMQHAGFKGDLPVRGNCQQLNNPIRYGALARAMLVALNRWVRAGTPPPDSRVPRIDDGTLAAPEEYCGQFPGIPGVNCNAVFNGSGERDFGPRVSGNSGVIDNVIPLVVSVHRVLVPAVDEIGNETAGIRHPFVEAPTATLTGWNLRRAAFTDGDLCALDGMWLPLPKTQAEREATGDPRPSLEELYGDHDGYVRQVADAALNLWFERLMLLEDVFQTIREADASDVLK
jgi:hypothetical protein